MVDTKNDDIVKKYFDLVQEEIKKLISEDKEIKPNEVETFNNEIFNQSDEIKDQIKGYIDQAAMNNLDIKKIAKVIYDKFKVQVKNNVFNQTDAANVPNTLMGEKTMNFDDFIKLNELKIGEPKLPEILRKAPPIKIGDAKYTLDMVQDAFNAGQKSILNIPSVIKVLNTDPKFVANFSNDIPQFNDWWEKDKFMKTYEQFVQDNKPNVTFYKDNNGYKPIFAYDGKNILGYITPGYVSEKHEAEKLVNVGTIWRDKNAPRGLGNTLYKLFIKESGRVIPSSNISDNAKKMFRKLFDDPTITNIKYDNSYRYKEEDYLNTIMTLSSSELNKLPEVKENTDQELSQSVEEVINKTKNEIFENEATNYTIGQSDVRDELMMKTGKYKSVEEIPYV